MKNILNKILITMMVAFPVFTSCVEEKIEVGEPENNSYGVYFETLTKEAANIEVDPADPKVCTFKAFRTVEDGDISVPVVFKASCADGSADDLFEVSEIIFEDGATETEFTVSYPNLEIGVTYNVCIECADPKYVKLYSQHLTGFSFSVTIVKWNKVVGKDGDEYATWKENGFYTFFNVSLGVNEYVEMYERDDRKGYYRFKDVYGINMMASIVGKNLSNPEDAAYCESLSAKDVWTYVDATNPKKIYMDYQDFGAMLNSKYGTIKVVSLCEETGMTEEDEPSSYGIYDEARGSITFPEKALLVTMTGLLPSLYYAGEYKIILPGFKDVDYSLELACGLTDSKTHTVPMEVAMGPDLAQVKYLVYSGAITEKDAEFKYSEVAKSEEAVSLTESGEFSVACAETGVYTIVLVGLDAEGNVQSGTSANFTYIKEGDSKTPVLTVGLGSAAKYAPKGYNTDTSLEMFIYGKELTYVTYGLYTTDQVQNDVVGVVADLNSTKPVGEQALKAINADGYVTPVDGLSPGTEYVAVVSASNGYERKLFVSEPFYTTGEPSPIYVNYKDINVELIPESRGGYYGVYNYYGLDVLAEQAGLRKPQGKVTISDGGTIYDEQYQESLEYVKIEGLYPSVTAAGAESDAIYAEFYNGILYIDSSGFGKGTIEGTDVYLASRFLADNGYIYSAGSALLSGYVRDGILGFFPNSYYIQNNGITFESSMIVCAFQNGDYTGLIAPIGYIENPILVDETKDESVITASTTSSPKLNRNIKSVESFLPNNMVQTEVQKRRIASKKYVDYLKSQKEVSAEFIKCPSVAPVAVTVTPIEKSSSMNNNLELKSDRSNLSKQTLK